MQRSALRLERGVYGRVRRRLRLRSVQRARQAVLAEVEHASVRAATCPAGPTDGSKLLGQFGE